MNNCSCFLILVELLEYKLQQEKCIVSDLHSTLSEEQKRASETRELLSQEKAAVSTLKSDLYERKQENERLKKSLEEHQREINKSEKALFLLNPQINLCYFSYIYVSFSFFKNLHIYLLCSTYFHNLLNSQGILYGHSKSDEIIAS